MAQITEQPDQLLEQRIFLVALLRGDTVSAISLGNDPRRSALIQTELGHLGSDGGNDLYGTGAGSDDGDAPSLQRIGMIPARRGEDLSSKRRQSPDVRNRGLTESSASGDSRLASDRWHHNKVNPRHTPSGKPL